MKKGHFTQIDNDLLRNRDLSFKARGIIAHLLSHQRDTWLIRMSELVGKARNGPVEGESAVRTGVKELIRAGYLTRERARDEKGHVHGWRYQLHDPPIKTNTTETRLSSPGLSSPGSSSPGKPSPKKTNVEKTNQEEEGSCLQQLPVTGLAGRELPNDASIPPVEPENRTSQTIAEAPVLTLAAEDDADREKFPWSFMVSALKRIVPEMAPPTKGAGYDWVMRQFWTRRGKTVSCFERLAETVQASDFLMGRNGHSGNAGKPYSWGWIFSKRGKDNRVGADRIMDGEFSNERMAWVPRKRAQQAAPKLTLAITGMPECPEEINLAELWEGKPRFRVVCHHPISGLPEVCDAKTTWDPPLRKL